MFRQRKKQEKVALWEQAATHATPLVSMIANAAEMVTSSRPLRSAVGESVKLNADYLRARSSSLEKKYPKVTSFVNKAVISTRKITQGISNKIPGRFRDAASAFNEARDHLTTHGGL